MSFLRKVATMATKVPGGARALSHVPFAWRKGRYFSRFAHEAVWFEQLKPERQREWILGNMKKLVAHAETSVPFYERFYKAAGFSAADLIYFEDIAHIPIITKADLKICPLKERCAEGIDAIDSNTGGTSGEPLSFRMENLLVDKEWSYIYHMWKRVGWRSGFLKLRFGGANLGAEVLRYVPTEGEFLVNTYRSQDEVCCAVAALLRRYPIHYLHGYPSALHSFARHAGEHFSNEVVAPIRKNLRGILLGSEFPAPCYRDTIEQVFGIKSFSWYGHSEKAILAGEKATPFIYHPFQSYGFTEAVDSGISNSRRMVGTNYHGFASPIIRYDTGDLIEPIEQTDGLLQCFKVAEGRIGDTVLDANGTEISLTALIFGRHHRVFGELDHLQLVQQQAGEVLLVVSGFDSRVDREQQFWEGFDSSAVNIRFKVMFVDEPIRTPAGKVALKVPYESISLLH